MYYIVVDILIGGHASARSKRRVSVGRDARRGRERVTETSQLTAAPHRVPRILTTGEVRCEYATIIYVYCLRYIIYTIFISFT